MICKVAVAIDLTAPERRDLDLPARAHRPLHRGGLAHHSDRGSRYVAIHHTERLAEAGIEPSVGRVGDSYGCGYVGAARWV